MLTGRPPFVGQTIVDVIQAKEVGTFPPARQSSAEVPERLDLIIAKMTAKSPKNRYQNCTEVIKDIEGLQLANDQLSFLDQQSESSLPGPPVDTHAAAKTRVPTAVAKSSADTKLAVPESFDPDIWYVQTKSPTGGVTTRKYTTAQLRKMVADDMINLTAFVSHSPTEGFRAAATYKEFQGMASSKVSKQAHDKNTARYRGLYKKIEEGERKREEREIADQENKAASASRRYWISTLFTVLPIVLGFILLVAFFYWIARIF